MILSDREILYQREHGGLDIFPFAQDRLGPNSYDVRLARNLLAYHDVELDAARENECAFFQIPPEGLVLFPGVLYLGVVEEFVRTGPRYVPMIDGTSSAGRLGISIHCTAGRGDAGFCGHFTLEISVVQKVRVYAGMPIGQIWFLEVEGDVLRPYGARPGSNYMQRAPQVDPYPQPSAMHRKLAKLREEEKVA